MHHSSPITPWHFTVSRGSGLRSAGTVIGRQKRGRTVYRVSCPTALRRHLANVRVALKVPPLTPSSRRTVEWASRPSRELPGKERQVEHHAEDGLLEPPVV